MATLVTENLHEHGATVNTRHGEVTFSKKGQFEFEDDETARAVAAMHIKGWTVQGLDDEDEDDEDEDETITAGDGTSEGGEVVSSKPNLGKKKNKKNKKGNRVA